MADTSVLVKCWRGMIAVMGTTATVDKFDIMCLLMTSAPRVGCGQDQLLSAVIK